MQKINRNQQIIRPKRKTGPTNLEITTWLKTSAEEQAALHAKTKKEERMCETNISEKWLHFYFKLQSILRRIFLPFHLFTQTLQMIFITKK